MKQQTNMLIYDGDCGFCERSAQLIQRLTRNQLTIKAWQTVPETMDAYKLSDEDGMRQAWYVAADAQLYGGAEAINRSIGTIWWLRLIAYAYYVPGLRQLEDRVYHWVAENRYQLPGGTPACKI